MTRGRYALLRGMSVRHAASRRLVPSRVVAVVLGAAVIVAACVVAGAWAVSRDAPAAVASSADDAATQQGNEGAAPTIDALPVPQYAARQAVDPCTDDAVTQAGEPAAVIAAFGGAEGFRQAVVEGAACIAIDDPSQIWVVVNKQRPLNPIDYAPAVVLPVVPSLAGGGIRQETADALDELAATSTAEGAGDIALQSGYRSYDTQVATFNGQVGALGEAGAEALSARPGYSEHQTGLAVDVVACQSGSCGSIYDFEGTTQATWVADNAWRFGFIVRYEPGQTAITGYDPEAWHLRFIGKELAQAYHDGGFHTFEEFFGLDGAPDYAD